MAELQDEKQYNQLAKDKELLLNQNKKAEDELARVRHDMIVCFDSSAIRERESSRREATTPHRQGRI
jgi:hypothetical protein